MRKVFVAIALAALACGTAFAEGEFSAKVDIDANLLNFTHTDVQNDEYIIPTEKPESNVTNVLGSPNFGDAEIKVAYTDSEDRFGAVIGFDFDEKLTGTVPLGDLYGWGRIGSKDSFFSTKFQLGKFTDRVIEKIGGDKDLGVLTIDVSGKANEISIDTTDSFGLGDDTIGFLAWVYVGPVAVNVFAAPSAYHKAQYLIADNDTTETKIKVDPYYSYKAGGSLAYTLPDILTIGASFRQTHTAGSSIYKGDISNDYGLYGDIIALSNLGVEIGLGYSGRIAFEDEEDGIDYAPIQHAVHLDAKYTGIDKLVVGLYNNLSFSTLAKDKTLAYDEDIAAIMDIYTDESTFVLYNELEVSYDLTEKFTPSLNFKNYYSTILGRNGVKDRDYGKDTFSVEAKATYKITGNASLRAGVKFENILYATPEDSVILRNNSYSISIPVGVTIEW
jgi:hypothetical protein